MKIKIKRDKKKVIMPHILRVKEMMVLAAVAQSDLEQEGMVMQVILGTN